MDRDIEQAADLEAGKTIRLKASGTIPASHATLTIHDPFKIEETAQALWELHNPTSYWTWANEPALVRERYRRDALAAATVIVPTTAEHIAAAIWAETHDDVGGPWAEASLAAGLYHAAEIARSFAAGLSAGTAGGDSDAR